MPDLPVVDWSRDPEDDDEVGPIDGASLAVWLHEHYPPADPLGHLALLADTPSAPSEDDGEQPPEPT